MTVCLVNAYDVKADVVCLQCKSCVITPERFRCELLTMGRYINVCTFTFSEKSLLMDKTVTSYSGQIG